MKKLCVWLLAGLGLFSSCDDGSLSENDSNGTTGSMARFVCKGGYLYVVGDSYLQTFDVSDTASIVPKSRIEIDDGMETVFAADSLLFMGNTSGMFVYSLENPALPQFVSEYTHFTSCDPVVVQGKYAYITLHSDDGNIWCSRNVNELQVLDISNISIPVEKAAYSLTNPKGLAIDGSYLFVCDAAKLLVMDATDPLDMDTLQCFELGASSYDVIAKNGLLTLSYSKGVKQYRYDGDTIRELSSLY